MVDTVIHAQRRRVADVLIELGTGTFTTYLIFDLRV